MKHADINSSATEQGSAALLPGRAVSLLSLCAASLLGTLVSTATAEEFGAPPNVTAVAAQSAFDFGDWPLLDLIDARTKLSVFFRAGVPAQLRQAALRRAWIVDPAIRDFRGLSENDWDFEEPNIIPGFGELGPEVHVQTMVAEILGTSTRVAALPLTRSHEPTGSFSLANTVRHLVFGSLHNW